MKRILTLWSALMLTCFSAVAQNYWYVGTTLPTEENYQAIATEVSSYPETYEFENTDSKKARVYVLVAEEVSVAAQDANFPAGSLSINQETTVNIPGHKVFKTGGIAVGGKIRFDIGDAWKHYYFGTTMPTADNYESLAPEHRSLTDMNGSTVNVPSGGKVYLLLPHSNLLNRTQIRYTITDSEGKGMVSGDNEGNLRYADFDYTTVFRHYIWVLSVEEETTLTFYYEDLTARVGVTAEDWHASGSVPDWAAPEVITHDGRRTPLAEVYEETTETTGTVMEQTITGLPRGSYQVTLYANAYYTPERGFDSDITEGQTDVVYVFANNEKIYIPAHIGTSVTEHDGVILDCDVTDGTLHLGMVAEKAGTNWHSIQIEYLARRGDLQDTIDDLTTLVATDADSWHAGGMVGWAGPEVTTRDGRQTALAEVYEETTETTGTVMEQTVTGLQNGSYSVTLYANAYYTPDRGFDSGITDGQTDVVYVFANEAKMYIPAHIGTSVAEHGEYTLTCNVTDGTLHLGMVAAKPGTNWHSIQIRSLDRTGDVSVGIKGDANGDGTVDVADIATVISYMAGQTAGLVKEKSDVNGDGTVDVADIATIIGIMANGGGTSGETYYWYVGHENPVYMTNITPLSSNDASAGAGWRTIGATLPTYSKTNPLWQASNQIVTATSKSTMYVALPSDNIKSRNDITGDDVTGDGWTINSTKKTLNGVEYTIWTSINGKKSFSETLY